jgi:MAF protein
LGIPFEIVAAGADESPRAGESPTQTVQRLSLTKAGAASAHIDGAALVIGADTVVVFEGQILGKPGGADDARRMLTMLRGRCHDVCTAVSVVRAPGGRRTTWVTTSLVEMRYYDSREIEDYIGSGDPFDKAGSYAIQHPVFRPVTSVQGCYANVMGLPLCDLASGLVSFGLTIDADFTAACSELIGYRCNCV